MHPEVFLSLSSLRGSLWPPLSLSASLCLTLPFSSPSSPHLGHQTSPPPLARTGTLSARAILYEPPTFWDLSLQIGNVAKASVSLDVTWSGLSVDKPGTLQTMNNARMLIGGERVLW